MICDLDEEALPAAMPDDELIAIVDGRGPEGERRLALRELLRRRSPRAAPVLRTLALDRTAPAELRGAAALALGTKADPENERTLLDLLATAEATVVRRAAESLGRIGGERAFAALHGLKVDTVAGLDRSVAFARTLIGYRLGIASERLATPPPDDVLDVPRDRAVDLEFKPVEAEAFKAARASLEQALPAIPVADHGSVRFTCRAEHLWIVMPEEVAGERASRRLGERSAVAAVVLKQSECPDGWYVYEYILTHPGKRGRITMFGVKPTGIFCHFGEMQIADGKVTMRLQALNTPVVPAIEFVAEYDGVKGALTMTKALMALTPVNKQRRPSVPAATAAPQPARG